MEVVLRVNKNGRIEEIVISNIRPKTVEKIAQYYIRKGCDVSIGRRQERKEPIRREVKVFEYVLWVCTIALSIMSLSVLIWSK